MSSYNYSCSNCTRYIPVAKYALFWKGNWASPCNFCSKICKEEFEKKIAAFYTGNPTCCYPGCSNGCYRDVRDDPKGRRQYSHTFEFCGKDHGARMTKRDRSILFRAFHNPDEFEALYHRILEESFGSSHNLPAEKTKEDRGKTPIHFYDRWDPYYEFTNFSRFPIIIDSVKWATSEHYFQAQKFICTPLYQKIQEAELPREAFEVSRSALGSKWIRSDWETVKLDVMKLALRAKFTQHEQLHDMLLATGSRPLVEHTKRDSFWGDGGDGSGCNHLGRLLEEVRAGLKAGKLKLDFSLVVEYDHMAFPSRENSAKRFSRQCQYSGSEMTNAGQTHSSDDPPQIES